MFIERVRMCHTRKETLERRRRGFMGWEAKMREDKERKIKYPRGGDQQEVGRGSRKGCGEE